MGTSAVSVVRTLGNLEARLSIRVTGMATEARVAPFIQEPDQKLEIAPTQPADSFGTDVHITTVATTTGSVLEARSAASSMGDGSAFIQIPSMVDSNVARATSTDVDLNRP